jgi:hypothetical protein
MEKEGGRYYHSGYHFSNMLDGMSIPLESIYGYNSYNLYNNIVNPRIHFYDRFTGKELATLGDVNKITGQVTSLDCDVTITGEQDKVNIIKHVLSELNNVRGLLHKDGKVFSGSGILLFTSDHDVILRKNNNGKFEDFGGAMYSLLIPHKVGLQANAAKKLYEESNGLFNIIGDFYKEEETNKIEINDDEHSYVTYCINIGDTCEIVKLFNENKSKTVTREIKVFNVSDESSRRELSPRTIKIFDKIRNDGSRCTKNKCQIVKNTRGDNIAIIM